MNENFEGGVLPQEARIKTDTQRFLEKRRLSDEEMEKIIKQFEGLENTLYNWVDYSAEDKDNEGNYIERREPSLEFDQVVKLMADNKEAREAVRSFFLGKGWEIDMDMATRKMDELTWALIDELEKRCEKK